MSDGLKTYRSYQLDKSIIKLSWSTILLASIFTACIFILIPFLKTKSSEAKELKITTIENISIDKPQKQKSVPKKETQKKPQAKAQQSKAELSHPKPPSPPSFNKPAPKLKVNFSPQAPALASFKVDRPKFKTLGTPSTSLAKSTASSRSSSTESSTSSNTGESKSIDYSATFSENDLDNDLAFNYRAKLSYPSMAERRGIEATVRCSYIINKEGRVEDFKIIETIPAGYERLFKSECSRTLRKWKFKPNMVNGRPVRVKIFQDLEFKFK